ncbi:MAG TPA: calcium/sodium antiporter [Candidatus Angelobacter sp.]|nr:calcium/sodium antiporter [Candidatus Angelobacter sp.]
MSVLLIIGGLVLLVAGGEAVVRGASVIAAGIRIPPVVIGLTVVAFGTSTPELAVALGAALRGEPDFVVGNVLGSNIYNVLLVLGASAIIVPLVVHRRIVRWDVPLMIVVSLVFLGLSLDGELSRTDALVLIAMLVGYLGFAVVEARRERADDTDVDDFVREYHERGLTGRAFALHLGFLAGGIALLVIGADVLVNGAVDIAETLGFDRLVIGLTVVALGTSAPELATSIIAAFRGERDIAVGNIVGSNILNILAVVGLTGLIAPDGVAVAAAAIRFDFPVMLAVAIACLPVFFTGHVIQRWEGVVFLGYAVAYTLYLVLDAVGHAAVGPYSLIMLLFVIPITVLTFAIVLVRHLRQRARGGPSTA